MRKSNILLLGSGGREHALAWKMKLSPACGELYIAPGNGGTGDVGTNVPIDPMDFAALGEYFPTKAEAMSAWAELGDHLKAKHSRAYIVGPHGGYYRPDNGARLRKYPES